MIKVQTTLVASPRNHLYRTGRCLVEDGLFRMGSNPELDHFGDFSDDLNLQSIFSRTYRNALDQTTKDLEGLIANFRLTESVLQPLNLAPVHLGQIRM